jgi:phage baseplate assembly protein V
MINMSNIKRLLHPLKIKISLMIGRAILSAIDNSGDTQRLEIVGLSSETLKGVDRLQNYGFESFPKNKTEVLMHFPGGSRSKGIASVVHDRNARPKDLASGEVCVYTDQDGITKVHRIHLKTGGVIDVRGTDIQLGTLVTQALVNTLFMSAVYNVHTHPQQGGGTTSPPNQLGVVGTHTTTQVKAS